MKQILNKFSKAKKDGVTSTLDLTNSKPEWRIGNMNNIATFIYCKFNSFQPIDEKDEIFEKRNYMEFMASYKTKFLDEIKKALRIKPKFKARLRLHYWVCSNRELDPRDFIGYHAGGKVYEFVSKTDNHKIINKSNYEEEYDNLIMELYGKKLVV